MWNFKKSRKEKSFFLVFRETRGSFAFLLYLIAFWEEINYMLNQGFQEDQI